MKRLITAVIALAAASFAAAAEELPAQRAGDGGVLAVTAIDAVAKVIATDLALRTVTIKGPEGKKVTISVPPEVPLDRIQKGSLLDVRYVEAEALSIGTAAFPSDEEVRNVTIAPQSGTRAEFTARHLRVTGEIRNIDRIKRALTIVGPDDKSIALNVAVEVAGFDEIKIGDTAVIEYTEAVALSAVEHAGGKADSSRL